MGDDFERVVTTQLATLTESVAGMRREFTDRLNRQDSTTELERQDSHLSRKDLHEKVNGVAESMGKMEGDIRVAAQVSAQTRETVKDLSDRFDRAAPTIADMENYKRLGAWVVGGGFAALVGTGLAAVAWGEGFKAWLAHWLGIK